MGQYYNPSIPLSNLFLLWDTANLRSDNRLANSAGAGNDLIHPTRRIYWTGTSTWNSGFLGYRTSGGSSINTDTLNISSSRFSFCLWNLGGTGQSGVAFATGNNNNISLNLPRFVAGVGSSVLFRADDGTDDFISKIVSANELNGWTFWAGTKNATTGNMNLYRNGTLWHSGSSKTRTISTNEALYIFSARGGSQVLASGLSMLAFYLSELSQKEIQQFYEATKGRYGL